MFGKSVEQAAVEYIKANNQEKERLRSALLKDPAKATAFLFLSGVVTLKENLTTSYRKAPSYLYQESMAISKKVMDDITNSVTSVGRESILEVGHYLRSKEAPKI